MITVLLLFKFNQPGQNFNIDDDSNQLFQVFPLYSNGLEFKI